MTNSKILACCAAAAMLIVSSAAFAKGGGGARGGGGSSARSSASYSRPATAPAPARASSYKGATETRRTSPLPWYYFGMGGSSANDCERDKARKGAGKC